MKQFKRIVTVAFVSITLMASSVTFAQGWGNGPGQGKGFRNNGNCCVQSEVRPGPGPGPGRVLRDEMFSARVDVLAEMTGEDKEEIKAKVQQKPMWAIMDEYKVDYSDFQKKMHEKAKSVVNQAVTDGKLTQEQADAMLERMEEGPRGPMNGKRGFGKKGGRGFGMRYNSNS